jgi:hypothetical protein
MPQGFGWRSISGSFAKFAPIRRASSRVGCIVNACAFGAANGGGSSQRRPPVAGGPPLLFLLSIRFAFVQRRIVPQMQEAVTVH